MATRGRVWVSLGRVAFFCCVSFGYGLQAHFNVLFMSGQCCNRALGVLCSRVGLGPVGPSFLNKILLDEKKSYFGLTNQNILPKMETSEPNFKD